jgi:hypothetical protein
MARPRSTRRFVILFPGRAGGTLLGTALDSHPDVTVATEPLGIRRDRGAAGQLAWTRRFLRGSRWRRPAAVGLSTKVADIADRDGFATLLRELDAYAVALGRRNEAKQVVSIIRARLLRSATGRWNLRDPGDVPGPVVVDPDEFARRLERVRARNAETAAYARSLGVPLVELDYADLLRAPAETFARVLEHLGVAPAPLAPLTVKATSDDLRGSVANLDELRARYAGTEIGEQLGEGGVAPEPDEGDHDRRVGHGPGDDGTAT